MMTRRAQSDVVPQSTKAFDHDWAMQRVLRPPEVMELSIVKAFVSDVSNGLPTVSQTSGMHVPSSSSELACRHTSHIHDSRLQFDPLALSQRNFLNFLVFPWQNIQTSIALQGLSPVAPHPWIFGQRHLLTGPCDAGGCACSAVARRTSRASTATIAKVEVCIVLDSSATALLCRSSLRPFDNQS